MVMIVKQSLGRQCIVVQRVNVIKHYVSVVMMVAHIVLRMSENIYIYILGY